MKILVLKASDSNFIEIIEINNGDFKNFIDNLMRKYDDDIILHFGCSLRFEDEDLEPYGATTDEINYMITIYDYYIE